MAVSRRELVKVAGAAMLMGVGLACVPLARAEDFAADMPAAGFKCIFDRYEINDVITAADAAFVAEHAIAADSGLAQGTYTLDVQGEFNGHACSILGNWYHADYSEDERWQVYGAVVQGVCPDAVLKDVVVGLRLMAFSAVGSSCKLIWKEEQCHNCKPYGSTEHFAAEFIGQYMGDPAYLAVTCYATFGDAPQSSYTLASGGTYAGSDIPTRRHLGIISSEEL